jgi:calcineurin-like phosphoesterase family protein
MKLKFEDLDRVWVTSDTHAFHINITKGTSSWGTTGEFKTRDFDHWQEMTEKMADNFNSVIPEDGILFHLGDWSFNGKDKIETFRNMLNVKEIHLITGNHDEHIEKGHFDHLFTSRQKYLELSIGSFQFNLFHFNISSWNNISRGAFHLHGHQHWQGDKRFSEGKCMDIGVDGNNLFPYKLTDVIEMLKDRKKYDENDHHAF